MLSDLSCIDPHQLLNTYSYSFLSLVSLQIEYNLLSNDLLLYIAGKRSRSWWRGIIYLMSQGKSSHLSTFSSYMSHLSTLVTRNSSKSTILLSMTLFSTFLANFYQRGPSFCWTPFQVVILLSTTGWTPQRLGYLWILAWFIWQMRYSTLTTPHLVLF